MNYGYFGDRNKEYVITRPDTPTPWINYLGLDEYCGIKSIKVDGKNIEGNILPIFMDRRTHSVKVVMG